MNWCREKIAGSNANGNSRGRFTSRSDSAATGSNTVPATRSAVIEKHMFADVATDRPQIT